MLCKNLFALLFVLFVLTIPTKADNITYDFTLVNAPLVGSFNWEITVPSVLTIPSVASQTTPFIFTSFNADTAPVNGGGCQIGSVELLSESFGGLGITTFFSPLCQGKFDSTTAGLTVTQPDGLGIYTFSGTGADGKQYTDVLVISKSQLPLTVPEPPTFGLLVAGLVGAGFVAFPNKNVTHHSNRT